jgi:isopentenyl diphosphate isomerase/L-lactate dehydrogenase-like FMN-dependent dehydrogenase
VYRKLRFGLSIEDKVADHSAFSRARNERFRASEANLNWLVNEAKIAPHIPVVDKSKREEADYFMHEKFELPQLKDYVKEGSNISVSVGDYFSTMLDQSMNWQDAVDVRKKWGKQFCLKGIR